MNQWGKIQNTYYRESSQLKVFKDLWKKLTNSERWLMAFTSIVFLGSLAVFYKLESVWWLLLSVVAEAILFFKLESFKNKLILDEYGSSDNALPLSDANNQLTRYLLFKNRLNENHITKANINDCFELVNLQIDIASPDTTGIKKITSYALGILTGILSALWKQLDYEALLHITLSIIMVVVLLNLIATLLPSKVERLKELKYFMLMYRLEV